MMPYDWFKALQRLDVNEPFGADQLKRYGYLPNERASNNLPVGFVIDKRATANQLGMTCAACHTGQIEYQKAGATVQLRIDGAPAAADFQQFLTDLTAAARATSTDPQRYGAFARAVLGSDFTPETAAELKRSFDAWVRQFGEFMDRSLPQSPWGPGRLDAFNMIFNRVAARDLGLPQNFAVADAPASYPFLWNASKQDRTQWNGGVDNGLFIHALGRNTGEVFGVFAEFKPIVLTHGVPELLLPPIIVYNQHSADFDGLQTLEEKITALKPPPWPQDAFPINETLAAQGERLFDTHCSECHGARDSRVTLGAWATPVQAVGTDPKMAKNAANRMVESGDLNGALLPNPPGARLGNPAHATDVLANTVVGTLLDGVIRREPSVFEAIRADLARLGDSTADDAKRQRFLIQKLSGIFQRPQTAAEGAYEARVLHGIWATAPYLHNGSVANLWELLSPPASRKSTFMVGSRVFDPKNVGFKTDESPFRNGTFTADPSNTNGNGNAGHVYGTALTEADRWALIEYLKKL
jgi:hypothetical protein